MVGFDDVRTRFTWLFERCQRNPGPSALVSVPATGKLKWTPQNRGSKPTYYMSGKKLCAVVGT
jgi:hypothetical protein